MDNKLNTIKIFVGTSEGELIALKVLEFSIKRHTEHEVEVTRIDNSHVPEPPDARFLPYTNFSFGRFTIPHLANYQGRAIYLDSDMIVFKDISELWNTPFNNAKILTEEMNSLTDEEKVSAVMLMDCSKLPWDINSIISGFGKDYDYEELMTMEPLLNDGDIKDGLVKGWNSLDHFDEQTRLLHYTKIKTQPWVYPGHKFGQLWIDELKMMLDTGAIDENFIKQQVSIGNARPSLLIELSILPGYEDKQLSTEELRDYDKKARFVPQEKLLKRLRKRKDALLEYEEKNDPQGFKKARRKRRWKTFRRHPLKFIFDSNKRK